MGLFVFLLSHLISGKVIRANAKTFASAIKKTPITFALFTSKKCVPCYRIQMIMDSVSDKYIDAIGFISLEFESSPQIPQKYNISYAPTIAIFRNGGFRVIYTGEWTAPALTDFCENMINADMVFLNSSWSLFDFQQLGPANLVISSPKVAAKADGLIDSFAGLMHVGVIEDPNLTKQLQFPTAVLTRPNDFYSVNLDTIDIDEISKLIQSPFSHIENVEQLYSTKIASLVVLLDENDPLHRYEATRAFQYVRKYLGDNISYQYCDFFKCTSLVNQIHIVLFNNPVFTISVKQGQRSAFEPITEMNAPPKRILEYIKYYVYGTPLSVKKTEYQLPKLYALDFIPVAGDPEHDVVLFMASPNQPMYKECLKKARSMAKAFENVSTIKFYEYNIQTEHVQGLQLPKSPYPQFSIWPADKTAHGSSFVATASLEEATNNIFMLMKKRVSDERQQKIRKKIKRFYEKENEEVKPEDDDD